MAIEISARSKVLNLLAAIICVTIQTIVGSAGKQLNLIVYAFPHTPLRTII